MNRDNRTAYCGQCGNAVEPGDRFCGTCGAAVATGASDDTQVIPRSVAAAQGVAHTNRRGRRRWVNMAAVSLILLLGIGAITALAIGGGPEFLGMSDQQPADDREVDLPKGDKSVAGQRAVSADSPPDPAFEHLLPSIEGTTDAPVMLSAELPDDMDLPAIDGYYSGDGYGIVFPYGPSETTTMASNADTLGTLTVYPEDEDVANEYFDAERIDEVALPDGTKATLRYMVPAGRAGSQGPFWEGKFDKAGFTYNLKVVKPNEVGEEEVRQALSTMVLVPEAGGQEPSWMSDGEISSLEEFGREYDEAVRREDWEETYEMLDGSSQEEFTEDEWAEGQQALADESGVPASLESVSVTQEEEATDVPVDVNLAYEDGSQETILAGIPLVMEDPADSGGPRRYLTEEEISELDGLLTSSEPTTFSSPEPTTQEPTDFGVSPGGEDEVREAVEQYYYAVDYESWDTTYYNLDAESKALFTEEEWIAKNRWYAEIEGLELDSMSVDVTMDGEERAEVTVDRTFADGTSITRDTVFVWEGYWRHHLTEEEKEIFMPGVPYEEFVEAQ
ncbi:hypothetical protein GBA63_09065 [Rubrobacter tropicus]|uniref:Zinc ribbon domain-containing protein n=1 Tax=Rubrobacter tropicus TaxID=2653851 RepID=A0A6G8Q8M2_9ACTN|nr:zinc ribbon domain-containing protein [Rubrobacter tropicus]QIN82782.1 hypothetical protein GBA63_09065 [Rubrobacter tropicus]